MTLPNCLVIGAAKSGTPSIYHYLGQHPQIYMSPIKEPGFFAHEGQSLDFRGPGLSIIKENKFTDIKKYANLFEQSGDQKVLGECSWVYLYYPFSHKNIKKYIPAVKLIAILRNPIERAFSHFVMLKNAGREPIATFEEALAAEPERIQDNWYPDWHYIQLGFYYSQLIKYYNEFDNNQIKVYLFEDFKANPQAVLKEIFNFLQVSHFVPDVSTKYMTSNPQMNRVRYSYSGDTKKQLIELYKEDILKLQDLINQDLSSWLI